MSIPSPSTLSSAPSLFVPDSDLQIRTTIVFGAFGTFLAALGIILSGLTLRVMYHTHKTRNDIENSLRPNNEIQMNRMSNYGSTREGENRIDQDNIEEDDDGSRSNANTEPSAIGGAEEDS
ncbi:hypothetical protein K458DRAFT_400773 [Lentithecium fluviatile CBS 122367]|uniref:Uncharacterized protein n=1 Tax=Lentithecium fluviatile CBS 122367 TaxID=1168545 RepID=A0A6G1JEG6_9PLEO|nr:hypothetical protein K458DRAFT_400773 [Lentithecium fluviatile CBS 122367]